MKRTTLLLLFFIPFVSCVSLSSEGEKVSITSNPKIVEGCKFIGQVTSSSSWGVVGAADAAYANATNDLRNKAGQMGANVVRTTTISNTMGGVKLVGEAFECK
jgi:hypothetical protein